MASFPILVNSIVHIVMYAYYQIASMGPQYHKLTTKYKKYVTIIQLVIIYIIKYNILLIPIALIDTICYSHGTHTTSCTVKLPHA